MHTITHIEIPAPDLQKAIAFYSRVFEWQIEIIQENKYAFFRIGNTNTGGGFDVSLKPAPEKTGPQIVIDVDDMSEKMKIIEREGGKIKLGKTEIGGGHGYYAIFQDTNGNLMQLHSRA